MANNVIACIKAASIWSCSTAAGWPPSTAAPPGSPPTSPSPPGRQPHPPLARWRRWWSWPLSVTVRNRAYMILYVQANARPDQLV
jgi:hypothetical protein